MPNGKSQSIPPPQPISTSIYFHLNPPLPQPISTSIYSTSIHLHPQPISTSIQVHLNPHSPQVTPIHLHHNPSLPQSTPTHLHLNLLSPQSTATPAYLHFNPLHLNSSPPLAHLHLNPTPPQSTFTSDHPNPPPPQSISTSIHLNPSPPQSTPIHPTSILLFLIRFIVFCFSFLGSIIRGSFHWKREWNMFLGCPSLRLLPTRFHEIVLCGIYMPRVLCDFILCCCNTFNLPWSRWRGFIKRNRACDMNMRCVRRLCWHLINMLVLHMYVSNNIVRYDNILVTLL